MIPSKALARSCVSAGVCGAPGCASEGTAGKLGMLGKGIAAGNCPMASVRMSFDTSGDGISSLVIGMGALAKAAIGLPAAWTGPTGALGGGKSTTG